MKKNITLIFALVIMAGFVGGCSNTWNGAGKDLQGIGGWLEDTF